VSDTSGPQPRGSVTRPGTGATPRGTATPEITRVPSWLATTTAWMWRFLVLLAGASVILVLLTRLYLVSLPVIIALILATLCVPPARALEARGLHRTAAASIVVIGGIIAFGGVLAALTPPFITQVQDLQPTVVDAIDQLFELLETGPLGWDREEVMGFLQQGLETAQERGGEIAGQVLSGAAVAVQAIAAISLALVLLFFFVKDGEQIVAWLLARTPDDHQETMRAVGRRAWTALAGFVRGTAAVALIDAVGIGIGLAIVGVPLVLPIAVLVFFGGFIPVIGAFVTGLLAVLVALAAGGFQQALIVFLIVLAVQQIESNVLQPVIMRRAVALHPVVILAALTAGATLTGVIGAFLAVPVTAVAAAVANELRLRHEAIAVGADPDDDPIGPPRDPVETDEL
jgi:putative heme transporter